MRPFWSCLGKRPRETPPLPVPGPAESPALVLRMQVLERQVAGLTRKVDELARTRVPREDTAAAEEDDDRRAAF